MKFRTFIIPLAVAAGLVLVLGVGLLGGFALRTPLYLIDRGGQATPAALQFVPKQSPVVVSVLVRPDRLAQLWEYLAAPKLRQSIKRDMEQIERALLADTGLSYTRDIQPWLGDEITAAVVSPDLDQDPVNGLTPGYLVALACRDGQVARTTLELFWQNRAIAGDSLTFEDRAGSRLIYARRPGSGDSPRSPNSFRGEQFATVLVANRFVLVANHPEVLRQAITAAQAADGNLQSNQRYKMAVKALPHQRIGLIAVNLPGTARWLQGDWPEGADPLALNTLNQSDHPVDWGLVSVGLDRQGILADAAWVATQGHALQPRQVDLEDWYSLARYLPEHLTVAALGMDLDHLRQVLQPLFELFPSDMVSLQPLQPPLDRVFGAGAMGLVLDGVDQTYALGLSLTEAPALLPDWLLVSRASDRLERALSSLDQLAHLQGLGVGSLDILGYPATVWTQLSLWPKAAPGPTQPLKIGAEVAGLEAKVDGYHVLTTAPTMLAQALAVEGSAATPSGWTQQLDRFERPSEGYVHLDWPRLAATLQQQAPQFRLWEAAARPILRHLQEITIASYGQTEQIQSMGVFLQLSN
jgi:hypothetical protein